MRMRERLIISFYLTSHQCDAAAGSVGIEQGDPPTACN
jgi:hypothetical protein